MGKQHDQMWIIVVKTEGDELSTEIVDMSYTPIGAQAKFNGLTRGMSLASPCGEFLGIQSSGWIEAASSGEKKMLVSLLGADHRRYELHHLPAG